MDRPMEGSPTAAYGGRGPLILGIIWTELIITAVLLISRVYVRMRLVKSSSLPALSLAWASYLVAMTSSFMLTFAVSRGEGNRSRTIYMAGTIQPASAFTLYSVGVSYIAVGIGKIAVVPWLLGITGIATGKKTKALLWTVGILNFVLDIIAAFTNIFGCDLSPAAFSNPRIGKINCAGQRIAIPCTYLASSVNAVSDIFFALYPIYIVYNLQMAKRLKVLLSLLMGLGVFTGVCGILKTVYLHTAAYHGLRNGDPSWDQTPLEVFQWTEMYLTLICSSVSPIWPLIRPHVEKISPAVSKYVSARPTGEVKYPSDQSGKQKITVTHDISIRHSRLGSKEDAIATVDEYAESQASREEPAEWSDWRGRGPNGSKEAV